MIRRRTYRNTVKTTQIARMHACIDATLPTEPWIGEHEMAYLIRCFSEPGLVSYRYTGKDDTGYYHVVSYGGREVVCKASPEWQPPDKRQGHAGI